MTSICLLEANLFYSDGSAGFGMVDGLENEESASYTLLCQHSISVTSINDCNIFRCGVHVVAVMDTKK